MGKFAEVFKYARSNDIKAINKSINDVGRRHHAKYMTNMMFTNDINANYQLLTEIQGTINAFYKEVSDNYLIKKNAQVALQTQHENATMQKQIFCELTDLTNKQLSVLVYQQAMKYYFRIDVENEDGFSSCFDEAVKYRIVSSFLHSDMKQILIKMQKNIEIVVEDTKNVDFLLRNYLRIKKSNPLSQFFLEQLADIIRNVVLRDSKFDEEYFMTVRRISSVLQQNFCGG